MTNAKENRPDCWSCAFFSITWDPKFPYGCDLMGFKSKVTTCLDVVRFYGKRCLGYRKRFTRFGDAKGKRKEKSIFLLKKRKLFVELLVGWKQENENTLAEKKRVINKILDFQNQKFDASLGLKMRTLLF